MSTYIVKLTGRGNCYGPFSDKDTAERFARYMTTEVDPAEVRTLIDPASDLLAWYENVSDGLIPRVTP